VTPNQRAAFLAELSIMATKYDVWARWLLSIRTGGWRGGMLQAQREALRVVATGLADDAEWIRERIREMRRDG
jgi:hypothetical protein